jgi:hypothetical protein
MGWRKLEQREKKGGTERGESRNRERKEQEQRGEKTEGWKGYEPGRHILVDKEPFARPLHPGLRHVHHPGLIGVLHPWLIPCAKITV